MEKFIVIPSEEGPLIKRRKSAEEIIRILKNTGKRKKKNITGKLWGIWLILQRIRIFTKSR